MKGSMVPAQLSWEWRCAIDPFHMVYTVDSVDLEKTFLYIFVTHLTTSMLNSKCWIHLRARYARRISEIDGTVVVVSWDSWPLIWTSTEALFHSMMKGETKRAIESVSNPQAVLDGDFQAWISSWTFGFFKTILGVGLPVDHRGGNVLKFDLRIYPQLGRKLWGFHSGFVAGDLGCQDKISVQQVNLTMEPLDVWASFFSANIHVCLMKVLETSPVIYMGVSWCFRKWWYPQNTPKWSFLVGKPMVVGYHHFRKPPYSHLFDRWNRIG